MMVRKLGLFGIAALVVLATLLTDRRDPLAARPAAHVNRPLPVTACAECHGDTCDDFAHSPHGHTATRLPDDQMSDTFAGKEQMLVDSRYRFDATTERLVLHSERFPTSMKMDWVLGSGRHALTGVHVQNNLRGETELYQLNVSWYPHCGLAASPGGNQSPAYPAVGLHHSHVDAIKCLECHASYVPVQEGKILLNEVEAGITCVRCHQEAATHYQAEGAASAGVDWSRLTPLESINRCGECHRRADEFTPDEITTDSLKLARFAPVSLAQSACFVRQRDRLDCMTCHDPHAAAETDPAWYSARCMSCHQHPKTECAIEPRAENCLPCHMPQVRDGEVIITDHWIRMRSPQEP